MSARLGGWEDVELFLRTALDHAGAKLAKVDPDQGVRVRLGGTSFRFLESEPALVESIRLCLMSDDIAETEATIFADYSGWHAEQSLQILRLRQENLISFDAELARLNIRAVYSSDRNSWDIFDQKQRLGVRLQVGPDAKPEWEVTAPLAHFCKWIAESDGKTMLHAASLAKGENGALLAGQGGAGKSGTTLGGLLAGLSSCGDDYTLLSQGPKYVAHAVYRSVKQDPKGLARLRLPTPTPLNWQGKAVFRPETINVAGISHSTPVTALIMPEVGHSKARVLPGDPTLICKSLTFSTLRQLGTDYASVFKFCAGLARELPCYKLELSAANDENVSVLNDLLGGHCA